MRMNSSRSEMKSSEFYTPKKKILTKQDLDNFQVSDAYKEFVNFIIELNQSVIGKSTNEKVYESEAIVCLLKINQTLKELVEEIKPEDAGISRFGNVAFKTWYTRANQIIPGLLESLKIPKESIPEVSKYICESFGNATRLDYGTGHEANFLCFLLCLKKLSLFTPEDLPAIVLRVFFDYIDLMRKIQSAYWLEPAGSHGVWGLDDYHFLPFLFGSAQLKGHQHFSPKCIHDSEVVDEFSKDYMYLACIKFVNTVKPSASLRWHSPMLDDISSVKTWDKVNEGMIKMYKAEVLGKLPIMQHFFLGSIISFDTGHSVPEDNCCEESGSDKPNEHAHVYAFGQEAPTCCGMRIPSAIGAAAFDKAKSKKPDLPRPTRIPFD